MGVAIERDHLRQEDEARADANAARRQLDQSIDDLKTRRGREAANVVQDYVKISRDVQSKAPSAQKGGRAGRMYNQMMDQYNTYNVAKLNEFKVNQDFQFHDDTLKDSAESAITDTKRDPGKMTFNQQTLDIIVNERGRINGWSNETIKKERDALLVRNVTTGLTALASEYGAAEALKMLENEGKIQEYKAQIGPELWNKAFSITQKSLRLQAKEEQRTAVESSIKDEFDRYTTSPISEFGGLPTTTQTFSHLFNMYVRPGYLSTAELGKVFNTLNGRVQADRRALNATNKELAASNKEYLETQSAVYWEGNPGAKASFEDFCAVTGIKPDEPGARAAYMKGAPTASTFLTAKRAIPETEKKAEIAAQTEENMQLIGTILNYGQFHQARENIYALLKSGDISQESFDATMTRIKTQEDQMATFKARGLYSEIARATAERLDVRAKAQETELSRQAEAAALRAVEDGAWSLETSKAWGEVPQGVNATKFHDLMRIYYSAASENYDKSEASFRTTRKNRAMRMDRDDFMDLYNNPDAQAHMIRRLGGIDSQEWKEVVEHHFGKEQTYNPGFEYSSDLERRIERGALAMGLGKRAKPGEAPTKTDNLVERGARMFHEWTLSEMGADPTGRTTSLSRIPPDKVNNKIKEISFDLLHPSKDALGGVMRPEGTNIDINEVKKTHPEAKYLIDVMSASQSRVTPQGIVLYGPYTDEPEFVRYDSGEIWQINIPYTAKGVPDRVVQTWLNNQNSATSLDRSAETGQWRISYTKGQPSQYTRDGELVVRR